VKHLPMLCSRVGSRLCFHLRLLSLSQYNNHLNIQPIFQLLGHLHYANVVSLCDNNYCQLTVTTYSILIRPSFSSSTTMDNSDTSAFTTATSAATPVVLVDCTLIADSSLSSGSDISDSSNWQAFSRMCTINLEKYRDEVDSHNVQYVTCYIYTQDYNKNKRYYKRLEYAPINLAVIYCVVFIGLLMTNANLKELVFLFLFGLLRLGMCYKTLRTRNFRSKLASSSLNKHKSLWRSP
jgi:hypothetical protein